jgi:hypothetical protein
MVHFEAPWPPIIKRYHWFGNVQYLVNSQETLGSPLSFFGPPVAPYSQTGVNMFSKSLFGIAVVALSGCGTGQSSGVQTDQHMNAVFQEAGSGVSMSASKLEEGEWSSVGANLYVSADGARIDLGCAAGSIGEVIYLTANKFTLRGTYTPGGGAEPVGGFKSEIVTYYGVLHGKTLSITMIFQDEREPIKLQFSQGPNSNELIRCL